MRLLFEMDKHDYDDCTGNFVRNSARSIIIKDEKIAMIHSLKYDYYKFPGGGIEGDESPIAAMIRETREEAGIVVKPETISKKASMNVEISPLIQNGRQPTSESKIQLSAVAAKPAFW